MLSFFLIQRKHSPPHSSSPLLCLLMSFCVGFVCAIDLGRKSVVNNIYTHVCSNGDKINYEVPSHQVASLEGVKISHCANTNFGAEEHLKSVRADYDLNCVQMSDNPLKESLRKTLLNQEEIFRKQVIEMHHLYSIQKNLMKVYHQKQVENCDHVKVSAQRRLGSFVNHLRNQSEETEKPFFTFPELVRGKPIKNCLEWNVLFQDSGSMSLDLTLPTSCCILDSEDAENKRHKWDAAENSQDDLTLSLSIGRDHKKNGGGRRICGGEAIHASSLCIVDLEESPETVSSGDGNKSLCCSSTYASFRNKQESLESIQSSCSFADSGNKHDPSGRTNCLEKEPGSRLSLSGLQCKDAKGGVFNFHDQEELDLNRDLVDELSYQSNVLSMASPPIGDSAKPVNELQQDMLRSAMCWKKLGGNCSIQTSIFVQQDAVTGTIIDSNRKNNSEVDRRHMICTIASEYTSAVIPGCQGDPYIQTGDSLHLNRPLTLEGNDMDVGNWKINSDNLQENMVSADFYKMEDIRSNGSLSPCKSKHTAEKCSSTGTIRSSSDFEQHHDTLPNSESSAAAKYSPQKESHSFMVREVRPEICHEKQGEFSGLDITIQKGAVSLLYFALNSSSKDQDGAACNAGEMNKMRNKKKDQPQCSLDSYESIVLKLPETNMDDYCVSSKRFELDDTSKKDCGIKLRRGRRFKDFRKDILPQLASLSSGEICEDMKIMEGVLRSREYKRLRSKMNGSQSWFSPVRSRRSKAKYVGSRFYSV